MIKKKGNFTLKNITEDKVWESENIFHLKSDVSRYGKLLSHYEIYKQILSIPGDIIECGVFKGVSLLQFASFRYLLETNASRKIIGFDDFGLFTNQKNIDDKKFISNWNKEHGKGINDRELSKILNEKKFTNFKLIKGDVKKTIPKYLKKNKHTKIALLHLDMDVYQPTIAALKYFYKLMSNNGIILIDDYAVEVGATKAIDYFFRNKKVGIKKIGYHDHCSYIVCKKKI